MAMSPDEQKQIYEVVSNTVPSKTAGHVAVVLAIHAAIDDVVKDSAVAATLTLAVCNYRHRD